MTVEQIRDYLDRKKVHDVEVIYLHKETPELRTAYFRGYTVDDAVNRFNEITDPEEDIILMVCLDTRLYDDKEEE